MTPVQPLTATLEDYLEAIYVLASRERGARVGDIARQVDVHKSTVTAALHSLAERELVHYVPYKPITLTARGRRLGETIFRRHKTLRRFLTDVLGIEETVAEDAACKMEHVIPPQVIGRFTSFADYIESCPRAGARFTRGFGYFCKAGPDHGDCERCPASTPDILRAAPRTRKARGSGRASGACHES